MTTALVTDQDIKRVERQASSIRSDISRAMQDAEQLSETLNDLNGSIETAEMNHKARFELIKEIEGKRMDGLDPDLIIDWVLKEL